MLPAFLKTFIKYLPSSNSASPTRATIRPIGAFPAQTLGGKVILDQRGERRNRDAKPNGPGRKIDIVNILGAARIRLRAAIASEVRQFFLRLVSHQILNGVKDGACMGLHRHAVFRAQNMEIKRRHDRNYRGAGRLVPSDLHIPSPLARRLLA